MIDLAEEKNYAEHQSHEWLSFYPVCSWNNHQGNESPVKGNDTNLMLSRKRM